MTGQRRSGFVDGGKTTVEEIGVVTDDAIDVRSMYPLLGFLINACRNDAVDKVRLNITDEGRLEQLLHVPGTLGGGYGIKGRVIGTKRTCQKLTRKHLQMIRHRKHKGLSMEMLRGGHPVSTGGDAERRVLYALQTFDGRSSDVACPSRGGEVELGTDEDFIGIDQRLFVLAPRRSSQGLQHLEPRRSRLHQRRRMVREGEERIQGQAQDLGVMDQGKKLAIQKNLRVVGVRLVRVGTEESHARLVGRDVEVQIAGPFGNEHEILVRSRFDVGHVDGRTEDREIVREGSTLRVDERKFADV